jgi:hypothetical protein
MQLVLGVARALWPTIFILWAPFLSLYQARRASTRLGDPPAAASERMKFIMRALYNCRRRGAFRRGPRSVASALRSASRKRGHSRGRCLRKPRSAAPSRSALYGSTSFGELARHRPLSVTRVLRTMILMQGEVFRRHLICPWRILARFHLLRLTAQSNLACRTIRK